MEAHSLISRHESLWGRTRFGSQSFVILGDDLIVALNTKPDATKVPIKLFRRHYASVPSVRDERMGMGIVATKRDELGRNPKRQVSLSGIRSSRRSNGSASCSGELRRFQQGRSGAISRCLPMPTFDFGTNQKLKKQIHRFPGAIVLGVHSQRSPRNLASREWLVTVGVSSKSES